MKHEWRKHEKELYLPKAVPTLLGLPKFKFVAIKGRGNPGKPEFASNIERLYALSYTIKMLPKSGHNFDGWLDYTVYPLEGLWTLDYAPEKGAEIVKDDLVYTIMIRQPDFVGQEIFDLALETAIKKKKDIVFAGVEFAEIEDGLAVQMMHAGPFSTERASFDIMGEFIEQNNLELTTHQHREIYLSDFRKTDPENLKTVLRNFVRQR